MLKDRNGFGVYKIISIIAFIVLATILLLPQFFNLDKKQKTEQCIKNMKRIEAAVEQYLYERQEDFKGDASDLVRFGYLKKSSECPEGGPGDKYFITGKFETNEIIVQCPNAVKSTPLLFRDEILDKVLFTYKIKYPEDKISRLINDSLSVAAKELLAEYRIHNNSLLDRKQVQDWGSVINNTRKPIDAPMKKVWQNMPDSLKAVFNSYDPVMPFPEENRQLVITALNNVIKDRDFYTEDLVNEVKLNREAQNLIKKGIDNLNQLEVQRVNRIILESVLPYIILESSRYNDPSERLFDMILSTVNNLIELNQFDQQSIKTEVTLNEDLQERYSNAEDVITKNRVIIEAAYEGLISANKDEFKDHVLK